MREGGAGWHLPWPIETLYKVNVMSVKSQEFRPQVLTSDVNLVDLHFSVQYRFMDPMKVLFQVRDPEVTLGEVSQSALREVVGQSTLQDVLAGVTRPQVTQRTHALDSAHAGQLQQRHRSQLGESDRCAGTRSGDSLTA